MCTALISVDPASRVPVLLIFARDEMADRTWLPPARRWPRYPSLVGGMDSREGGTWLAVRPGADTDPRAVCLLNGFGTLADPVRRVTRGQLPLLAAFGASLDELDLTRYDPFHLLVADETRVSMLTWDGSTPARRELSPGTHLVSNRGLEVEDPHLPTATDRAVTLIEARIKHFRPLLQSTPRPEPSPGVGDTEQAWAGWMRLADGDGLDTNDVRALIGKHDWGEGGVWLTSSVSLIAIGRGGVRYDFRPAPEADVWSEVDTAR